MRRLHVAHILGNPILARQKVLHTVMLKLDYDIKDISRNKVCIAGINCYIYNADVLRAYAENAETHAEDYDFLEINVLYLSHHRGGDYSYTEAIAYNILKSCSTKSPLIAVTFDARNHGERLIQPERNSSWRTNETHALDMLSAIEGGVQDLRIVMNYLPAYLNLDSLLGQNLKQKNVEITFNNILSGYSMGAHTVIRFANLYPESVSILNPNVGCADLTTLLVNRLKKTTDYDKKIFYREYEELKFDGRERTLFPQALYDRVREEDQRIFERYPFRLVKLFACFYDSDPLVPPQISKSWLEMYLASNSDSDVVYEKGEVHDITPRMISEFSSWLKRQLA